LTVDELSRRLIPGLIRRRALILWSTAGIAAISTFFSALLYADLRSGLEELLPETAPSVVAIRTVTPRLHSTARLSIDLEGSDPDAMERFADDLASRLRALPPALVESVEYRSDEQDRFLDQFGPLYLDPVDLRSLRDQFRAQVAKANPLAVDLDDQPAQQPAVDLAAALEARRPAVHFRNGYFQTPEGKLLVLQVWPPESSTGLGPNRQLLAAVQRQIDALQPSSYDPQLHIGFSGEVAELVEQQAALASDLASSTVVVLLLVLAALWLYYRRWGAIAAVVGSLAAGCSVTFGLAWFLVGHLNANTAFLGSIVVGNGINVGIIFVARYLERRREGTAVDEALQQAWSATLASTFVAAFGAGLAYLSLAATDFRGFSQFGVVGALGMALCWLSAYLVLPPLLSAIESRWPIEARHGSGQLFAALARFSAARPAAWLICGAMLLTFSAAAVASYRGDVLESDMARIGAKKSLTNGALFWAGKANEVFQSSRTPIVLESEAPDQLERTLAALDGRRRILGSSDPLREVISLGTLVPRGQEEKIALVGEIRSLLSDAAIARLPPELRERARAFRSGPPVRPVTFADLPSSLRRAISERDGTAGRIALIYPRKVGRLDLEELDEIKELVRGSIDEAGARVQALNTLLLISDIDDVIVRDAPRATLLALSLVCALVMLVMRRLRASATVMAALLTGVAILVGTAAAARVRMNFLNFVVLPITFGIGVDYAVNIVQRYRQSGSLEKVLRETGSAVALCSLTTVIGYASLMVADSQALAGFGLLAALGEVTCLFTALFVLPAWLARSEQRQAAAVEPALEVDLGS